MAWTQATLPLIKKTTKTVELEEESESKPVTFFEWNTIFGTAFDVITIILALIVAVYGAKKQILQKISKLKFDIYKSQAHTAESLKEINKIVTQLQVYSDSDRVIVYQIHNGENYKSGLSRCKISVTNEEFSSTSISSLFDDIQDTPIEKGFLDHISLLSSTDSDFDCVYYDVKESKIQIGNEVLKENTDKKYHAYLLVKGVAYAFDYPFRVTTENQQEEIIGFVSLQYLNELKVSSHRESHKEILDCLQKIKYNLVRDEV